MIDFEEQFIRGLAINVPKAINNAYPLWKQEMSETYSAMLERLMKKQFSEFAEELERRMYEPPDFLRRIQEEERQKMSDTIYDLALRALGKRIEVLENPPRKETEQANPVLCDYSEQHQRYIPRAGTEQVTPKLEIKEETSRKKYEFQIIKFDWKPRLDEIESKLTNAGQANWMMVGLIPHEGDWVYLLQREIIK